MQNVQQISRVGFYFVQYYFYFGVRSYLSCFLTESVAVEKDEAGQTLVGQDKVGDLETFKRPIACIYF